MATNKVLYIVRVIQLLISIAFLGLVADSSVHRGWWDNINGAVALGVIASLLTLALSLHGIITRHLSSAKNPFSNNPTTLRTIICLTLEIIILLCWIGSVGLMLRGKGGCPDRKTEAGIDLCVYEDKKANARSNRPVVKWNIGIAFGFVEIVLFIASGILVFKEDRAAKVTSGGGAASYA